MNSEKQGIMQHKRAVYQPPRIIEKTKLKIDIQTNSVTDGGYHS